MSLPSLKQLRAFWPDTRWAFGKARAACPRLFTVYWINAATSMLYPAGIALSVRGLVNAVSAGLDSGGLDETAVYLWLLLGLVMTLGTAIGNAANRHLANRFRLELQLRINEEIMCQNLSVPFARFEQQDYRDKLTRASNAPEMHITQLYSTSMELLTIGDLAIYGSAAAQMRTLVDQCMQLLGRIHVEYLHVQRLRQFLEADFELPDRGTEPVPKLAGDIRFDKVFFSYPGADETTLSEVSFHLSPGETVALVGRNGAGKSTVAKLLAGFYQPDSGGISIDGCDISKFDPEAYSRAISLVPQHFGRYSASAADNIAFGQWEELRGRPEAVESVGQAAGIDDMIRSLPEGYDTILGREFGDVGLSGGQWQHLAIARVMARTAPVLIMDEPTASLDVEAEFELFQRLRELAHGTTTLLISHRFTTVSMADKILVMDGGRIVEAGTHRELLAKSGQYASMYQLARKNFPPA